LDKELVFTVELEIREMLTNYGYDGFDVPLIFAQLGMLCTKSLKLKPLQIYSKFDGKSW